MVDKELNDLAADIFSYKLYNGRVWAKNSEFNYPDFLKTYGVNYKKTILRSELKPETNLSKPDLKTTTKHDNNHTTIVTDKIGMPQSDVFFSTNFNRERTIEARRAFIAIVFAAIISLTLNLMYRGRNLLAPKYSHPGTGLLLPSRQLKYSRFY